MPAIIPTLIPRFYIRLLSIPLFLTLTSNASAQNRAAMSSTAGDEQQTCIIIPATGLTTAFYWQADASNEIKEPHAAMLVPVKLAGCPRQFYMQFDLGSPYSVFYKNKLSAIWEKYPKTFYSGIGDTLENFNLSFGRTAIKAKHIPVKQFDSSGINWTDKHSMEIIGTIGADLIDRKTILIDYPRRQIQVSDSISFNEPVLFRDMYYQAKHVLLPATINGKQTILYFDTGSSMFELLTDKHTAEKMASAGATVIHRKLNSWGNTLEAKSLATADSLQIGGVALPIRYATWIEGMKDNQASQMMKMGIGGMTGNKLFIHSRLLLDTRTKKFAVLPAR